VGSGATADDFTAQRRRVDGASQGPQARQLVQRAEQKRSGARGGIEHAQSSEVGWADGGAVEVHPCFRVPTGQIEALHEHARERRLNDVANEGGGRVVAAARAPLIRRHDAFEHPSQHVGGDVGVALALDH